MVGLVETLTVDVGVVETLTVGGPVETLSNLHFFLKKAKLDFLTSLKSIVKISSDETSQSTLMILKNWLIDLLNRYHRISVNEMVLQEGGNYSFYSDLHNHSHT